MQFDLRSFHESAKNPYHTEFSTALSQADFGGFTLAAPAECAFTATPTLDGTALLLCVKAKIQAECARCLEPLTRCCELTRDYLVRDRDLEDPDFELPCNEEGCLDLEELVFQEILFEVPPVLLCSADCKGLCPVCGKKREGGCTCHAQEQQAPTDERLSVLKQLLS